MFPVIVPVNSRTLAAPVAPVPPSVIVRFVFPVPLTATEAKPHFKASSQVFNNLPISEIKNAPLKYFYSI